MNKKYEKLYNLYSNVFVFIIVIIVLGSIVLHEYYIEQNDTTIKEIDCYDKHSNIINNVSCDEVYYNNSNLRFLRENLGVIMLVGGFFIFFAKFILPMHFGGYL